MAKNVDHIQHVKSSVVLEENGVFSPKLPNPSVLADGEIAVNYAKGYETLSIKNSNSGITTFSSDDYYTEKKLGSGFTGENSANTVTKVIEDNELTISSALNDLNQRKLDASAYTPTDLSNYYTKSETSGATQIATALNGKADASDIMQPDWSQTATTENDYIKNKPNITNDNGNLNIRPYSWGGDISIGSNDLMNGSISIYGEGVSISSGDDDININSSDNIKLTTAGNYKVYYNNKEVATKNDIPTVSGYADSVKYNSTSHAIEFYHGTTGGTKVFEVDASAFIIDGMVENVEIDDVTSGSSTVKCLIVSFNTDAGKQDINIPISDIFDPDIYYTKEEIDDAELTISSALNDLNERKLDASAYTPTDLSNYYTKSETSGATQIATALSGKADASDFNTHTADTSIHLTSGDIQTQIDDSISGKVNVSDVVSAITPSNSGSTTNPVSVKVVAENEMVVASALNDLNENKLDVTAYTPTEGETIHYLTGMTGAAGGTNLAASWSGNCSDITELYTGLCVRFLIPTAGHATGVTLSINGGEKHKVLYNNTGLTTQYSTSTILNLTYDADTSGSYRTGSTTPVTVQGVWRANADYNSNTDTIGYSIGHNQVVYKTDAAAYRYMLLLSKDETTLTPVNTTSNSTASTKTLTTESFNPFGDIIYKSSTGTVAANTSLPSTYTWTQYQVDLRYSFNVSTLVPQESVYIVAVPQSDGKAKLYDTTGTTTITQTLPTTENGNIYIYLGQAYDATHVFLLNNHPIYWYKDGQIRLYTNSSASVVVDQTIDSGTSASTNAVATQAVYNTIKDTELVWTNAYNALSGVVSSHSSSYVTSMGGYTKPSTTSAISTGDTLNQAVGKLECALGGIRLQSISQSDYDALVTKDPNTLYIITS